MATINNATNNAYEQRQQARKRRYERLATTARKQAIKDSNESVSMLKVLPPGQPILSGHHSEKKHRNLLAHSDNKMRQSIKNDEKAKYYERKANGVGNGGISSDDPKAIEKIEDQIKNLEQSHTVMKAANKLLRKNPKDKEGLLALGLPEKVCEEAINPPSHYPLKTIFFNLSGNRADIRRLQMRLRELKQLAQAETVEIVKDGYTLRHDREEKRVMFILAGKPSNEIRTILKKYAFKWSPRRSAWVRQATANGLFAARTARRELDKITAAQ